MANETLTGTFTNIADAIRAKSGSSSLINPLNMGNEIRDLKDLTPAVVPQSNLSAVFQDVADAIRECGVSGTMTPIEMPTKIGNIVVDTGDWLCFTAEEANSTVAMAKNGSAPTVSLEYSTDGENWNPFVVGTTTVTLANIGDYVYVRADSTGNTAFATSISDHNTFVLTGSIAASGNVDTLLDQNGNATLTSYCYAGMFYNCTSLTTAPELPNMSLAERCYVNMFWGCSLTTAPTLSATTLAPSCYQNMFHDCRSLTTAPALPATTLAFQCYRAMFSNCSSLTTVPTLSATTLTESCYHAMFEYCSSLTTTPSLPATTLATSCYQYMFSNCTSLTAAPELPATTLANYCYYCMFQNCTSLTSAPALPATTLVERCYTSMFRNCSNLASINVSFTAWNTNYATSNWVNGVAASGTFTCPSTLPKTTGNNNIPTGWTIVEK